MEHAMIKIDFSFGSKYGTFSDALHLPDDHTLSYDEIEQLKQQHDGHRTCCTRDIHVDGCSRNSK